jgi:hypothetical protein
MPGTPNGRVTKTGAWRISPVFVFVDAAAVLGREARARQVIRTAEGILVMSR